MTGPPRRRRNISRVEVTGQPTAGGVSESGRARSVGGLAPHGRHHDRARLGHLGSGPGLRHYCDRAATATGTQWVKVRWQPTAGGVSVSGRAGSAGGQSSHGRHIGRARRGHPG